MCVMQRAPLGLVALLPKAWESAMKQTHEPHHPHSAAPAKGCTEGEGVISWENLLLKEGGEVFPGRNLGCRQGSEDAMRPVQCRMR